VFVAIGYEADSSFLEGQVELTQEGYVIAGEDCRTNVPGVFIAGDLRTKGVRQIVTAAADGAVAALGAADELLKM
ncbi:FAD-dependent oxidoreductase, partial [Pseudomonas aeruginosa]|nr:FAD-dependent oxidoreductase [Pseudomonas aeruginosa]